jgi:threonyl-tRNA synthetase
MPLITLPDGSTRTYDQPLTIAQVAKDIGSSLAKVTLAGEVDGQLHDSSYLLQQDVKLRLIRTTDPEGLEVIRHSAAHLLAQAVKQLFPEAQVTIGPVIENGFYYDFFYPPGFTEKDLPAIEKRMKKIAKHGAKVERKLMSRKEAIAFFQKTDEDFKVDIIKAIPGDEQLSFYSQDEFTDLCRGPHVPNTSFLKAFSLQRVSGAYWRGDSNNPMLQRIYGTAWASQEDLDLYLHRVEEAKRRDHRVLGKKMQLFSFEEIAAGMVFWHPRGWSLYQQVAAYIRKYYKDNGYQEVLTPQVVSRVLWEKSGHWEKFADQMFITETENRTFAIKPMNCPCHVQIFKHNLHSYRDLPLRLAELGSCHRCEPSGSLHGLMRLRNFVQDDGHIFCREDQIQSEVSAFIDQVFTTYAQFGFTEVKMCLSTRPDQRIGDDSIWDKSEKALEQALDDTGKTWDLLPGEGAFYGPKIEFSLKDCLDRVWQCGTIQVDFSMPERLDATYIDEDSKRQHPVMLHRAILGSLERFIGILIENTAGDLPLWLAPVQIMLLSISEKHAAYVKSLHDMLEQSGFRVQMDCRNEKIGYKIREHSMARLPYLLICGEQEAENKTASIRSRLGEDLGSLSWTALQTFFQAKLDESSVHTKKQEILSSQ